MNYTGEKTVKHFAEFMQNVMQRLQQQQVFSQPGQQPATMSVEQTEKTPHGIAYDYDYVTVTNPSLIGSVTCNDEGVCYLTAKESGLQAESKPQQPPPQPAPQQYQPQRPYQPPQQAIYQPQYTEQQPYYPPAQPTNPMMTQAQQQFIPGQPQYQQQYQYKPTPQYQYQQPQQYQAQYQPQYQPQQQKPFY